MALDLDLLVIAILAVCMLIGVGLQWCLNVVG